MSDMAMLPQQSTTEASVGLHRNSASQLDTHSVRRHGSHVSDFMDGCLVPRSCAEGAMHAIPLFVGIGPHLYIKISQVHQHAVRMPVFRFDAPSRHSAFDHTHECIFEKNFVSVRHQL